MPRTRSLRPWRLSPILAADQGPELTGAASVPSADVVVSAPSSEAQVIGAAIHSRETYSALTTIGLVGVAKPSSSTGGATDLRIVAEATREPK